MEIPELAVSQLTSLLCSRYPQRQRGSNMEPFSWSDSLRALAEPCLSCLSTSKTERNDLEDLLADSGSTTTETLSLHSNPGAPRPKRARFTKNIRLFGWNLFGRPPIRLPDDDDDEDDDGAGGGREQGGSSRRSRRPPLGTLSSSTLDSDAAPLDLAAIEARATKHAEDAARAERRERRRERKERGRAALTLALEHAAVLDGNAEFEGFPGSGDRPPPPSSFARGSEDSRRDDEDGEEEGDFGAGAYARRTRGGSDSGRGSDSRSRTSSSLSPGLQQQQKQGQGQPYNHHYIAQQPSAQPAKRSKKGKSSRSSTSKTTSSSRRSRSSPSASQSPSLASPVATQFSDAPSAPRTTQEFEGAPNDLGLHTVGIERLSSGFPSPGFGGPRNGKRDMGAFLANRGDA